MKSFSILYPDIFITGKNVTFIIDGKEYVHIITESPLRKVCYLTYLKGDNDIIFHKLGIDRTKFMKDFFNMKSNGNWPEVPTIEMLKKQLKYLEFINEF